MFLRYFDDGRPDVVVAPGETLFSEGDDGDRAYVIAEGYVDLIVKGEELTTLEPSDIVGEMALVDDRKRFATARAGTHGAKLFSLDRYKFSAMIKQDPEFALDIMRIMAARLRAWGQLFEE